MHQYIFRFSQDAPVPLPPKPIYIWAFNQLDAYQRLAAFCARMAEAER
jgi:hypothetical protein